MPCASLPQPVVAFERFTRQGPLALLPHPDDAAAYAVVWCCPPDQAQALQALSPSDFNAALNRHFGDRLGTLTSVGERHVFPLSLHAGASVVNPRTVAIGNAAPTLHPVAGQGLNLGLRDVAQLSRSLSGWLADPSSDVTPWLREFTQRGVPTDGLRRASPTSCRVFSQRANHWLNMPAGWHCSGSTFSPGTQHTCTALAAGPASVSLCSPVRQ